MSWIADIHNPGGRRVGRGVVIDRDRILTLPEILNNPERMTVSFPFAPDGGTKVVEFTRDRGTSGALTIEVPLPSGVEPAPVLLPTPDGLFGRVWWAPADTRSAADVFGRVSGLGPGTGWVRLAPDSAEATVSSGSGIWSPAHRAVVGLWGGIRGYDEFGALTLHQIDAELPGAGLQELAKRSAQAGAYSEPTDSRAAEVLASWGDPPSDSVVRAFECATGFSLYRARQPGTIDTTLVLLGALAYAYMSNLPGVTKAFTTALVQMSKAVDPAAFLDRFGAAAGVGLRFDGPALYPPPAGELIDQRGAARLMALAARCARRLGSPTTSLRHLVLATVIMSDPPLDPAVLESLELSIREVRQALADAARIGAPSEDAATWDELLRLGLVQGVAEAKTAEASGGAIDATATSEAAAPPSVEESAVPVPAVVTDLAGGIAADRVDPTEGFPLDSDQLDTAVWVSMLATVIVDDRTPMPLSIGIFGEWGSGKSHFMGMLVGEIRRLTETGREHHLEHVIPISFNAWHYSDANLWASLGDEIFRQLAGSGQTPDELRAHIRAKLIEHSAQKEALEVRTHLARDETIRLRKQLDDALAAKQSNATALLKAASKADTVKELLKQVWAGLGVKDEAERAGVLADQLRNAVSAASAARGRFRRRVAWMVAVVAAVLAATIVAFGWLPSLVDRVTAGAVGLAGIASALAIGVRWATKANAALAKLNQATTEIRRLAKEDAATGLKTAFDELHAAEAMERVTESQLAEVDAQVAELAHQLTELMPGQRLYSFIASRAASDAYVGHLGLISTIRRDFEQLVDLLKDWHEQGRRGGSPRPMDRIVLYIDDLDRCRPRQVVEVLQAVHLLLALDLFVVVVGVDPRWLLRSLREQYGGLLGGQATDGALDEGEPAAMPQEYLEKIFNIPFALPAMPRGGLGRMLRSLVRADEERAGGPGAPASTGTSGGPASVPAASEPADSEPARPNPGPAVAEQSLEPEAGSEIASRLPAAPPAEPPRQLTEPELALLGELEALVDTPRAGKRLLNLYRMLRSTRDLSSASRFLGDESTPGEFQAVVVLLGLVISDASLTRHILDAPARAGTEVAGGLMARPAQMPWSAFVDELTPDDEGGWHNGIVGALAPADLAAWQRLAAGLARVNAQVTLPDLTVFQRWAPHVRRFSFILSPLAAATSDGSHASRAGT